MLADAVDLDSLIGGWRLAFDAAQSALRAGSHDLTADELRAHGQRLAEERSAVVRLLEGLARERRMKHFLVRLVSAPWEAKRLLGVPADTTACVFNVDGVLVASAAVHAEAWRDAFDELIAGRIEHTGLALASFSIEVDYPQHIHGRTRSAAVRGFLASRGIALPDGSPDDRPGAETVHGVANRKTEALRERLTRERVDPYEGARLYLELAQDAKLRCAVVSGSTNLQLLLDRARLAGLVDDCVDGNTALAEGLRRKPEPDMLLAACRHLDVDPEHAVVFETTPDGVAAGRAAGFELVVAVDRDGRARALQEEGADLVVADLGELLERQLGG